MSEYVIHVEDVKTLYKNVDFPFPLDAYLREKVVRCMDCKYHEYWKFRDGRTAHDCARGGDYLFDTEPDGFCKWGERQSMKTCGKDKTPCLHESCLTAQNVDCCSKCEFMRDCTTACFKVKGLKEND